MAKTLREIFIEDQIKIEKLSNPNGKSFLEPNNGLVQDSDLGFLANSLESIDPILKRPLYKFFAFRDLPFRYVGGAKELASYYKTNYSLSDRNPIASGQNNVILTVDVQLEKYTTRISAFSYILKIGLLNSMKAQEIGYDIYGEFDNAVGLQHARMVDQIAFFGLPNVGESYGLFNHPDIPVETAETKWEEQGASELFDKINSLFLETITRSEFDESMVPDRMLVPLPLFGKLAAPMAVAGSGSSTATTGTSLYNYLRDNLARDLAGYGAAGLAILPNKYLAAAGTNGTGRILIYRYNEEAARGIMGMELTRGATVYDPHDVAYKTTFMAFVGEPQIIKPGTMQYYDNAA